MTFAVARTPDFDRVFALPWRVPTEADACSWATALTPFYAEAGSTVRLGPWQAFTLAEIRACQGGLAMLPVGLGKTLISFLAPIALESRRSLLIMKGRTLIDKTEADFRAYRGQWRFPSPPARTETLEWLSTAAAAPDEDSPTRPLNFLEQYDPDLIVIDEVDDLASTSNAAVRRIDRLVRHARGAAERHPPRDAHPDFVAKVQARVPAGLDRRDARRAAVRVVGETGTPLRKSLMGIWHILGWCLDGDMPMPVNEKEARMWALALDLGNHRRPALGPLGSTLDEARDRFRQRLLATPGIVAVDGDSCNAPLTVRVRLARECDETNRQFERFLVEQENPGGIPVSDPLLRNLLDGQLGLGLYSYWDPAPPDEWYSAWRAMAAFARIAIENSQHGRKPIETLGQVIGRHRSHPTVIEWQRVKPLFKDAANRRTAWFSRAALDSCHDWLRELDRPGCVMCGSIPFGRALAAEARLPYYGPEGKTSDGTSILEADRSRSFVASWQANKKGINLQDQPHLGLTGWPRQLIVMPPSSAKWLEQIIGRVHRQGQVDPVVIDLLATSGATLDLFERAIGEAAFDRSIVSMTQKILRAEIVRAAPTVTNDNAFRWAQRLAA